MNNPQSTRPEPEQERPEQFIGGTPSPAAFEKAGALLAIALERIAWDKAREHAAPATPNQLR